MFEDGLCAVTYLLISRPAALHEIHAVAVGLPLQPRKRVGPVPGGSGDFSFETAPGVRIDYIGNNLLALRHGGSLFCTEHDRDEPPLMVG
jgi:hypothetical protein